MVKHKQFDTCRRRHLCLDGAIHPFQSMVSRGLSMNQAPKLSFPEKSSANSAFELYLTRHRKLLQSAFLIILTHNGRKEAVPISWRWIFIDRVLLYSQVIYVLLCLIHPKIFIIWLDIRYCFDCVNKSNRVWGFWNSFFLLFSEKIEWLIVLMKIKPCVCLTEMLVKVRYIGAILG